ncbi:MAG: hypothetical protein D3903_03705 [Candidatus Electrothrix sp. GM3_4]|nr:hypothetical protein [Candidatus Electrothrix sp. GM3_4]
MNEEEIEKEFSQLTKAWSGVGVGLIECNEIRRSEQCVVRFRFTQADLLGWRSPVRPLSRQQAFLGVKPLGVVSTPCLRRERT